MISLRSCLASSAGSALDLFWTIKGRLVGDDHGTILNLTQFGVFIGQIFGQALQTIHLENGLINFERLKVHRCLTIR